MKHGLNFNRSHIMVFLSFVSLWVVSPSLAQSSGQTKDEFSAFEEELGKNSAAKPKDASPAVQAKAPPKTPPATPAPQKTATAAASPMAEDKIESLKKQIRTSPKNAALIATLGEELYKKGDYEKATLLLWKHVDIINRQGLLVLARAHEKRKESSEMIRALNVVLGKDENDFEAYTLLGAAYVIGKKNREALENFKKAVELNPKYEPAYDGLIALYENREPPNLYELRILFQDLVDNIGARPQYLHKLCEINTLDATYEAAITTCKEAIAKDPQGADSYVYLGLCYKATNDEALAAQTLKKASLDFPKSEFAQFQYGQILEEQKSYVEAMKLFKKGTEVDPKSARSWLGLATSSFEIRKYEVALIAYNNACKYNSKNAVAFRRATTILRNQKNSQWIGKFEAASERCTFQ